MDVCYSGAGVLVSDLSITVRGVHKAALPKPVFPYRVNNHCCGIENKVPAQSLVAKAAEAMTNGKLRRPKSYVIGPYGQALTTNNLPLPSTRHWVPRKKAEIVLAVRGGLLSLVEACERYELTSEEFLSWQTALDRHGLKGLRVTNRAVPAVVK